MQHQTTGPPQAAQKSGILPRAAGLSFALGLIALRVCWLPGINCILALGAITLGILGLYRVLKTRGVGGLDEAVTGIVLGIVVLGLSTFFIAAFTTAWR
ncbi:MAG: hypothetical protein FJX73_10350 [Armatimonadetes bacterium]|nr:hypothetical protein [Armatimonadota bacterium]